MLPTCSVMLQYLTLIVFLAVVQCDIRSDQENGTCESNSAIVASVNHLGLSIASELYGDEAGNFLYSPLGLSSAIGMAYLGARGQTAQQIEQALKFTDLNIAGIQAHKEMQNMTSDTIARSANHYNLNIANAIFVRRGLNIQDDYNTSAVAYYNATSEFLDFVGEQSMDVVNRWVKTSTSSKISWIIDQPLPSSTSIFLANAIYFKGDWKVKFSRQRTVDQYFHVAGENRYKVVPIMIMTKETFRYSVNDELGYRFLELPYKGEEISMFFALPLLHEQVPNLNMTSELFCTVRSNMRRRELDAIAIPRFRIEYQKKLKPILSSMGISDAFSAASADFSGIIEGSNGIYISDIVHKAVIEVNEEGSEAAAVTGIHIMPVSARRRPEFIADHSFLFYIIDARSSVILFAGRVMEP